MFDQNTDLRGVTGLNAVWLVP